MSKRDYESITITQEDVDGELACWSCERHFTLGEEVQASEYDYIFCGPNCIAEHEQNQAEAAHERFIERYHGSDTPVTQEEQYMQAWQEKRRMR